MTLWQLIPESHEVFDELAAGWCYVIAALWQCAC